MNKIIEKINPLNSLPQYENHFSKRQVSISAALMGLAGGMTFAFAVCQLLIYESRSGGYAVAMAAQLPLFVLGLFSLLRAHSLEKLYESGEREENIRKIAKRIFIQSIALTVLMVSVITSVFILLI
jgi:hypothetical protein